MFMNFDRTDAVRMTNVQVRERGLSHARTDNSDTSRQLRAVIAALASLLIAGCGSLPSPVVSLPASYTVYTDSNPAVCNTPDTDVTRSIVAVAGPDASTLDCNVPNELQPLVVSWKLTPERIRRLRSLRDGVVHSKISNRPETIDRVLLGQFPQNNGVSCAIVDRDP